MGLKLPKGFTLIELMIVVAILGILMVVALPGYQLYSLKSRFTSVISSTASIQTAIEICAQDTSCVNSSGIANVAFGSFGLPSEPVSHELLAQVSVSNVGVITSTASNNKGLAGETFILTPTFNSDGSVRWATSGTCVTRVGGRIC